MKSWHEQKDEHSSSAGKDSEGVKHITCVTTITLFLCYKKKMGVGGYDVMLQCS